MSEYHATFAYLRQDGQMRVRSLCGSWEMPLDEAVYDETTIDCPIHPDDARECERCRAAANLERTMFRNRPPIDSLDDYLYRMLICEARLDSYAQPAYVVTYEDKLAMCSTRAPFSVRVVPPISTSVS